MILPRTVISRPCHDALGRENWECNGTSDNGDGRCSSLRAPAWQSKPMSTYHVARGNWTRTDAPTAELVKQVSATDGHLAYCSCGGCHYPRYCPRVLHHCKGQSKQRNRSPTLSDDPLATLHWSRCLVQTTMALIWTLFASFQCPL